MAPACAAASLGPPASPQHGQGSGCPPVRRRGPGAEGEEETDAQDRRCPSAESGFPFLKPHEKRECQLVGLNADHGARTRTPLCALIPPSPREGLTTRSA